MFEYEYLTLSFSNIAYHISHFYLWRKPPTCRKTLTNVCHTLIVVLHRHVWESNTLLTGYKGDRSKSYNSGHIVPS